MPQLPDILADVNAEIRAAAARSAAGAEEWEFLCECGHPRCGEHVRLTLAAYEALLATEAAVLATGHTQSAVARARHLREEAKALRAQARQQVNRARRNTL